MASSIIVKKDGLSLGEGWKRARIPGVLPGVQFGKQVISSGIPSLDPFIGGGLGLGSILIILDHFPSQFSDMVLKCFLAEGATYGHHLYVASSEIKPSVFARELPSLKKETVHLERPPGTMDENSSDPLKIAWRYQHPSSPSGKTEIFRGQKRTKFEFTKKSNAKELGSQLITASTVLEQGPMSLTLEPVRPAQLLQEIAQVTKAFSLALQTKKSNNVLRIGISHCEEQVVRNSCQFINDLRSIVRSTNTCAILTLSNLDPDPTLLSRILHFADTVIDLQGIVNPKEKSELGDIDGLCKIIKCNVVNALKPTSYSYATLGFSYRRKILLFQDLHLPPDGETTVQRTKLTKPQPVTGCGTIKGQSMDF